MLDPMQLFAMGIFIAWTAAGQPIALRAERVAHTLVLDRVYLNGAGPFRMMVDTGEASSLIRPEIARRLSLHPNSAVEQVTISGIRKIPMTILKHMAIGALTETSVEAMIGDVRMDGVDGVLGQSWLARHDYLLDYRNHRIVIDEVEPEQGVSIPFRSTDGRPVVSIDVDGRVRDLVLDSGAPSLVLFESRGRAAAQMMLLTNGGSTGASLTSAKIKLPGDRTFLVLAACVASRSGESHSEAGLLPASMFRAIYVSNHNRVVRLCRR